MHLFPFPDSLSCHAACQPLGGYLPLLGALFRSGNVVLGHFCWKTVQRNTVGDVLSGLGADTTALVTIAVPPLQFSLFQPGFEGQKVESSSRVHKYRQGDKDPATTKPTHWPC